MTTSPPKQSDLGVRAASAVVMVAVAGTALWLGGWVWTAFVALVALGVLWEWWGLASVVSTSIASRAAWSIAGLIYIGLAAATLMSLRAPYDGIYNVSQVLLAVIGVDIGAYFAGRTIGGPKIAPRISPSKTWAGLLGGVAGASVLLFAISWAWPTGFCQAYFDFVDQPLPANVAKFDDRCHLWVPDWSVAWQFLLIGSIIAIVAQTGDFFESWMKRKAGVKDSSNLIPGHGGLFDRTDGLLAVCFVGGFLMITSSQFSL
jgi:phosphatidate cytidylyltransferase